MPRAWKWILSDIALILVMMSCIEPEEGCLDPLASNYEVAADVDCCCSYPVMNVNVLHVYDSSVISRSQRLGGGLDPVLFVHDYAMFLSDFAVHDTTTGSWRTVRSEIEMDTDAGMISRLHDLLVTSGQDRRVLGEFVQPSSFDSLRFRLGLPVDLQSWIADEEDEIFGSAASDLVNQIGGYDGATLVWSRDSLSRDTLVFSSLESSELISIPIQEDVSRGSNIDLSISLDYQRLFEGLESTMSSDEQMHRLFSNALTAWYAN